MGGHGRIGVHRDNYKLYIVYLDNLDNLYYCLSGIVAFHLLLSTIQCVLLF